MQINQESEIKGFEAIINYLNYHHVLNNLKPQITKINLREKKQIKKCLIPQGGLIKILVQFGQLVKTGNVLYQIFKIKEEKIISLTAENSGIVLNINRQQSLNQGEYILSILEND